MFSYSPLSSPTAIRVLDLHPGSGDDELNASLILDDLDAQTQQYEAISYFWGPPVFSRRLIIDGEHLSITQTLYDALMRLRLPEEHRVVWADAICINQSSTDEKNRQVRLMSRIYTQCERGIVYLGPEAAGSEVLCDFFQHLMDWLHKDAWSENPSWKRGPIFSSANSFHEGLPGHGDPRYLALVSFLRRPWFRRLWVIQEFALPKDLLTICGQWELQGDYLPTFLVIFTQVMPIASLIDQDDDEVANNEMNDAIIMIRKHLSIRLGLGRQWNQIDLKSIEGPPEKSSMFEHHLRMHSLVDWAFNCQVTDPRDRFFGLLSLANDLDDDPSLQPDYNKSLQEVEDAYSSFFIRQGFGSILLARAQASITPNRSQPSWRTSWAASDDNSSNFRSASISDEVVKADDEIRKAAVSQISSTQLAVDGFDIDELSHITTGRHEGRLEILDEILGFDPNTYAPQSLDSFQKIALRVLMLNKTHLGESPASEEYLDMCEMYIDVIRRLVDFRACLEELPEHKKIQLIEELGWVMHAFTNSRGGHFGRTKEGYFGMFPHGAQKGDQIFMIDGDTKTFLVRHQPVDDTYIWLGQIYVLDFDEQIRKSVTPESTKRIVVA